MRNNSVIVMNDNNVIRMAYHQAGHAVAALEFGQLKKGDYVTISPDRQCKLGFFRNLPGLPSEQHNLVVRLFSGGRNRIENFGVICLAGNAAECRYLREKRRRLLAGKRDRKQLVEVLRSIAPVWEERKVYCELLEIRAEILTGNCWPQIEAVAKRLLSDTTLTHEQIREVSHEVPLGPRAGYELDATIEEDDEGERHWIEATDDFDLEPRTRIN